MAKNPGPNTRTEEISRSDYYSSIIGDPETESEGALTGLQTSFPVLQKWGIVQYQTNLWLVQIAESSKERNVYPKFNDL